MRSQILTALLIAGGIALSGCGGPAKQPVETSKLKRQPFGKTAAGEDVELFTFANKNGMEATITNYGGIVVTLKTPDRTGKLDDIVLGYDTIDGYLTKPSYFGALIGRYGTRIAKGKFTLDGKEYTLARNNGENALHGGLKGFNAVVWKARDVSTPQEPRLELTYVSKDGEEGYPGTLTSTVIYSLTDNNELKIEYAATTDKDTVVNLTNHSYFNLKGQGEGDILDHEVQIDAGKFTPVDAGLIPTGELKPVEGTPFDFRKPTAIGARINAKDEQLVLGKGYDHNFVLTSGGGSMAQAARVVEPKS